MAGAEIVDRHRDAEILELAQRAEGHVGIAHGGRFGDLELEQAGGQAGLAQGGGHQVHELGIVELPRRQVHGDLQAAFHADEGGPAAGFAQHPLAELQDHAGFLGELDEFGRRHQPALGMLPAHQRLVSGDAPGARVDHRLVVHAQLVLAQSAAQVALEREAARGRLVHLGGEELVIGAAHLLGVVHRRVGVADQRLGIAPVVGKHRDADGRRDRELALVGRDRARELLNHLLRHLHRIRGAPDFGQHHHELVAPDAADGVADAQLVHQSQRHFAQQQVAYRVAQGIVDGLEAVEVDEHDRRLLAIAMAERQRLREAVLQQAAVGQPG